MTAYYPCPRPSNQSASWYERRLLRAPGSTIHTGAKKSDAITGQSKNLIRRWCAMGDCSTHEKIRRYVTRRDPHDLIAHYLLHTANGLTGSAVLFGAAYLLTHSVVKVVLISADVPSRADQDTLSRSAEST